MPCTGGGNGVKGLRGLGRKIWRRIGAETETDRRGGRFVAVIECLLNQNSRDSGAATFAAMNWDVIRLCNEYNVGVLQMPCPEMECLGFGRDRPAGKSIREALDTAEGRECCRKMSINMAHKAKEYLHQGYQFLAVLGGNPESPGCAVHVGQSGLLPESGVFMRELQAELQNQCIEVLFRGIRDFDTEMMAEDMRWLETVFSK